MNCQKHNPGSIGRRYFSGPDARRCARGRAHGTKKACSLNCRESNDVYTELLLPFNVRDRFVGGSGAAGDPHLRIPTQMQVAAAEQTSGAMHISFPKSCTSELSTFHIFSHYFISFHKQRNMFHIISHVHSLRSTRNGRIHIFSQSQFIL